MLSVSKSTTTIFDVILVMYLFTCQNGQKTIKIIQKDAMLLFEVSQILIQTINQRKLLFKEIIQIKS